MHENAGFVIKGGTGEWKLASKENTSGLPAAALVVAY